jgi:hypothetical protein
LGHRGRSLDVREPCAEVARAIEDRAPDDEGGDDDGDREREIDLE